MKEAFSDILIPPDLLDVLGPAIASGKGLFLFGEPGNGKTSIAERISRSYASTIYIPKVLFIDGQIIQLYDSQCHELAESPNAIIMDMRWVHIKRPAIVVGGELELKSLDVQYTYTRYI